MVVVMVMFMVMIVAVVVLSFIVLIDDIVHAAYGTFTWLVAAAACTVHRADVCRGVLLTLLVDLCGGFRVITLVLMAMRMATCICQCYANEKDCNADF
jgi:hypothetical protein